MVAEHRLHTWMMSFTASLIEDLSDEQIYLRIGTTNSPAWILGHLAAEGDKALTTLGKTALLPSTWHESFLQGSSPDKMSVQPSKQELWQANVRVYKELSEAVLNLASEQLAEASHSDFLREYLPTRGAWLGHILTTHIAMHAGQIQYWRRLQGLERGFEK
ncbi:MAG: DinB family protein [Candidatus Kapabacteria bacterium]|jgi:hypothetical protein|nr:DinB family protein [Candidatus Kapabacteria bacterium]